MIAVLFYPEFRAEPLLAYVQSVPHVQLRIYGGHDTNLAY